MGSTTDPTHQPAAPSNLSFHPLSRQDFPLLSQWLSSEHVARWWRHDPSPGAVERDFGPSIDGADRTRLSLVFDGGRPVGLVQSYRIGDNPEWARALAVIKPAADAVGIDYLIGEPDATGRGLGTEMVRRLVDEIWWQYPTAPAVVVAVQQANPGSWRVLEKAGFRRVWSGVLESDDPSDQGPSHLYLLSRPSRVPPSGAS